MDNINAYCLSCEECCSGFARTFHLKCYDSSAGCRNYDARPIHCKTFPFFVENTRTPPVCALDGGCRYVKEIGLKDGDVMTAEDINNDPFLSKFFGFFVPHAKERYGLNADAVEVIEVLRSNK